MYGYVGGDPVGLSDPLGRAAACEARALARLNRCMDEAWELYGRKKNWRAWALMRDDCHKIWRAEVLLCEAADLGRKACKWVSDNKDSIIVGVCVGVVICSGGTAGLVAAGAGAGRLVLAGAH